MNKKTLAKVVDLFILCCFSCILSVVLCMYVSASDTIPDVIAEEIISTNEDTIMFHEIPWYLSKPEAERILMMDDNVYNTSSDYYGYINTTESASIIDGGITGIYYGVNIAGHTVTDTNISYYYDIDENGIIDRSENNAKICLVNCYFDHDDYNDLKSVFVDIYDELALKYGEGTGEESDYGTSETWHDSNGNEIVLYFFDFGEFGNVNLKFSVADAAERSIAIKEALKSDKNQILISFRGIPWGSSKEDTEHILKQDDGVYNYASSYGDYINTGDLSIEGGGITRFYFGVNVAGYEASITSASFYYNLDENGNINRSEDAMELCYASYQFDTDDYTDVKGVYEDLSSKLSSLYGFRRSETSDSSISGEFNAEKLWYDSSGNRICLHIFDRDNYGRVDLEYSVVDVKERAESIKVALEKESTNDEKKDREKNKGNVSGL